MLPTKLTLYYNYLLKNKVSYYFSPEMNVALPREVEEKFAVIKLDLAVNELGAHLTV